MVFKKKIVTVGKSSIVRKQVEKKVSPRAASRNNRPAPPVVEEKPVIRTKGVPQVLRGMKDVLPAEQKFWRQIRHTAEDLAEAYGFERIETPILESTPLFVRSVGVQTDVVEKEMFSFIDRGGDNVTLRPEGTAPVVRSYINHGMFSLPQPVKLYYLGPMFRYERPQQGRFRQHNQFGVEVFGDENFVSQISVRKTATPSLFLDDNHFFILWYSKSKGDTKFRKLLREKPLFEWVTETRGGSWGATIENLSRPLTPSERRDPKLVPDGGQVYALSKTSSAGASKEKQYLEFEGKQFTVGNNAHWKTTIDGMNRVNKAGRLEARGGPPWFRKYHVDSPFKRMTNVWDDTSGKSTDRIYVVQTEQQVVERCILMASDPGDLVLDPTCGSGTTAYVAEQWGRRWITIDTSRVALSLARARIMGARYSYYILADSRDGQIKEAEVSRSTPSSQPIRGDIRQGFVYERVPYVTLGSIANNTEIDIIWERFQVKLEPLHQQLNQAVNKSWEEWVIPREADEKWSADAKKLHAQWWQQRIARQKAIDASIAAKAEFEYLYDKPYDDKKKVRVAGPFTVESLSPHRVLAVDENDELIDPQQTASTETHDESVFVRMILENLKTAGVQQAHKEDKITFSSLTPWPGDRVCAEGRYLEGTAESGTEKRAAIFIGPEFGTVSRPDLVEAAHEAGDAGFDALIACAFNYDARSSEFDKLGRIPVLKARMNADLHMADDLKNTGKGNLFVIFGEPDIDLIEVENNQIRVKINGVDVFHPNTGEVRSDGAEGIACWFIDTDYNEESFFVRHAYFLGAGDPYKSLKTTLKAEINEDAWAILNSDTSRPFDKPESGRIAVKVINHLGDEVMKVFRVV